MEHSRKIKHLYHRAGFGLTIAEEKRLKNKSITKAVEELFRDAGKPSAFSSNDKVDSYYADKTKRPGKSEKQEFKMQSRKLTALIGTDWVQRMALGDSPLLDRMMLFWHGHFACRTILAHLVKKQLNALEKNALGNFRDLLMAIAKDGSMIRYLNNQQNNKRTPNENFARELMELFTIGRGNYTEGDVKEAARAFTGWKSDFQGNFKFTKHQHDYGSKTFMGKTGNFDGTDIIDIILEKRETSEFIAGKVYRYFVNPKEDQGRVKEIAKVFYDSGYDIAKMMRHIFTADWFYDERNIGAKIKSPVELMAGLVKTLHLDVKNPQGILFFQKALGQTLFNPPNVAGWRGDRAWIDNSTLMMRLNLPTYILSSAQVNMRGKTELESSGRKKLFQKLQVTADLSAYQKEFGADSPKEMARQLSDFFLQAKTKNTALLTVKLPSSGADQTKTIIQRILSLPEYQMC